ncbi:hypothetical protein DFP72DRAFT_1111565 [Ephemerocybe angulata]|uniref:Uncharacterized protein n=1 Tax=Ephemerocybe angulata TaxID=980116 RepID=A0A8H6I4Q1_9AGAR|nr:hypothetical protein DFP72DRAFT_1111565 [Tulosesus angulatus]
MLLICPIPRRFRKLYVKKCTRFRDLEILSQPLAGYWEFTDSAPAEGCCGVGIGDSVGAVLQASKKAWGGGRISSRGLLPASVCEGQLRPSMRDVLSIKRRASISILLDVTYICTGVVALTVIITSRRLLVPKEISTKDGRGDLSRDGDEKNDIRLVERSRRSPVRRLIVALHLSTAKYLTEALGTPHRKNICLKSGEEVWQESLVISAQVFPHTRKKRQNFLGWCHHLAPHIGELPSIAVGSVTPLSGVTANKIPLQNNNATVWDGYRVYWYSMIDPSPRSLVHAVCMVDPRNFVMVQAPPCRLLMMDLMRPSREGSVSTVAFQHREASRPEALESASSCSDNSSLRSNTKGKGHLGPLPRVFDPIWPSLIQNRPHPACMPNLLRRLSHFSSAGFPMNTLASREHSLPFSASHQATVVIAGPFVFVRVLGIYSAVSSSHCLLGMMKHQPVRKEWSLIYQRIANRTRVLEFGPFFSWAIEKQCEVRAHLWYSSGVHHGTASIRETSKALHASWPRLGFLLTPDRPTTKEEYNTSLFAATRSIGNKRGAPHKPQGQDPNLPLISSWQSRRRLLCAQYRSALASRNFLRMQRPKRDSARRAHSQKVWITTITLTSSSPRSRRSLLLEEDSVRACPLAPSVSGFSIWTGINIRKGAWRGIMKSPLAPGGSALHITSSSSGCSKRRIQANFYVDDDGYRSKAANRALSGPGTKEAALSVATRIYQDH